MKRFVLGIQERFSFFGLVGKEVFNNIDLGLIEVIKSQRCLLVAKKILHNLILFFTFSERLLEPKRIVVHFYLTNFSDSIFR